MNTEKDSIGAYEIKPIFSQQLYHQSMLAHHKKPIGFNKKVATTNNANGVNHACGDVIQLDIVTTNQDVIDLAFHGHSCAICRASASILCQNLVGLTLEQAYQYSQQVMLTVNGQSELTELFSKSFIPLISVKKFPARKLCALLPWQTFNLALKN